VSSQYGGGTRRVQLVREGARALTPGWPARQLGSGVCAVAFGRDGQTAARREAVGMALHARLGAASPLGELDPGVVREIMDAL